MNDKHYTQRQTISPPPWETRQVQQVPYVEPAHAHSGRKSSRAESTSSIPRHDGLSVRGRATPPKSPAYTGDVGYQQHRKPYTAHHTPPYDTTFDHQALSSYANTNSGFLAPRAPPTPPDSVQLGDQRSGSLGAGQTQHKQVLSGTMSSRDSRERSRSGRRARSAGRAPRVQTTGHASQPGIGKKFKSAIKDLFHHSPVDTSNCETVKTRHWTEDEY